MYVRNVVGQIYHAMQFYQNEFSTPPSGTEREIVKVLSQTKIDGFNLLVVRPDQKNERGDFVDPWKTPYRITTSGTNIEVRSAGPDGKFGTPDDIAAP